MENTELPSELQAFLLRPDVQPNARNPISQSGWGGDKGQKNKNKRPRSILHPFATAWLEWKRTGSVEPWRIVRSGADTLRTRGAFRSIFTLTSRDFGEPPANRTRVNDSVSTWRLCVASTERNNRISPWTLTGKWEKPNDENLIWKHNGLSTSPSPRHGQKSKRALNKHFSAAARIGSQLFSI